jgi:hypothetical protein
MAKHLSMEDLIKKYQYLKTTQQTATRTEILRASDKEFLSKIIFLLNN